MSRVIRLPADNPPTYHHAVPVPPNGVVRDLNPGARHDDTVLAIMQIQAEAPATVDRTAVFHFRVNDRVMFTASIADLLGSGVCFDRDFLLVGNDDVRVDPIYPDGDFTGTSFLVRYEKVEKPR